MLVDQAGRPNRAASDAARALPTAVRACYRPTFPSDSFRSGACTYGFGIVGIAIAGLAGARTTRPAATGCINRSLARSSPAAGLHRYRYAAEHFASVTGPIGTAASGGRAEHPTERAI